MLVLQDKLPTFLFYSLTFNSSTYTYTLLYDLQALIATLSTNSILAIGMLFCKIPITESIAALSDGKEQTAAAIYHK